MPEDIQPAFQAAWLERQSYMEAAPGFEGFRIEANGTDFTVVSEWHSVPEWEALNLSKPYRRSHLPTVRFRLSFAFWDQ